MYVRVYTYVSVVMMCVCMYDTHGAVCTRACVCVCLRACVCVCYNTSTAIRWKVKL